MNGRRRICVSGAGRRRICVVAAPHRRFQVLAPTPLSLSLISLLSVCSTCGAAAAGWWWTAERRRAALVVVAWWLLLWWCWRVALVVAVGAAVPSRWDPFFLFLKTFYAKGQMGLSAHLYRGWGP
jgi:hypothetical protein